MKIKVHSKHKKPLHFGRSAQDIKDSPAQRAEKRRLIDDFIRLHGVKRVVQQFADFT